MTEDQIKVLKELIADPTIKDRDLLLRVLWVHNHTPNKDGDLSQGARTMSTLLIKSPRQPPALSAALLLEKLNNKREE
jgi:hypothetical protein